MTEHLLMVRHQTTLALFSLIKLDQSDSLILTNSQFDLRYWMN